MGFGHSQTSREQQRHHLAELHRTNRRLEAKLAQAETVIVIQKKVASLLGIPLKSSDPEEND